VAKEHSETVAETIKETLKEFAELEHIPINKLLVQLTSMMSDRSSVMKKTNAITDDWRTLKLSEDLNETEIKKLNFFYCAAHALSGFHSEITKSLKELAKHGHYIFSFQAQFRTICHTLNKNFFWGIWSTWR
jgi:ribosomal protein L30E